MISPPWVPLLFPYCILFLLFAWAHGPHKDEAFYNLRRSGLESFRSQAGHGPHAKGSASRPEPMRGVGGWEESGTTRKGVDSLLSLGENVCNCHMCDTILRAN